MEKKVFISHSSQDKEIAEIVCSSLENAGIGCWIAPRDIPYGSDWAGEIADAIKASRLFVFLLTESSNKSRQCPKEITIADHANIPMICIVVDDVVLNSTLEYHFSSKQQAVMIDAAQIKLQIGQIVGSVQKALNGIVESQGDVKNIAEPEVGFDEQIDQKFDELFGPEGSASSGKSALEKKIEAVEGEKFIQRFAMGIKAKETSSEKYRPFLDERELTLFPDDYSATGLQGKHFTIKNMPGVITVAYEIIEQIDFKSFSRFWNPVILEYLDSDDESGESTRTFFVDHSGDAQIAMFHFDTQNNKVFVNSGMLIDYTLRMSKHPTSITFGSNSRNELDSLNLSAYDLTLVEDNGERYDGTGNEYYHETDLRMAPAIIINPDDATQVKREVYYDENESCLKARIKLIKNKSYFAFKVVDNDNRVFVAPLSNAEKAEYYLEGTHGFPRDVMAAVGCLSDDESGDSLRMLARIFRDEFDEMHEANEYLKQAIAKGSSEAIVDLIVNFISNNESTTLALDQLDELMTSVNPSAKFVAASIIELYRLDSSLIRNSFELYYSSAENGYMPAIIRLNCASKEELKNCDKSELFEWYEGSYGRRKELASFCLGSAVFFGWDIAPYKQYGLSLIKESADQGNLNAQYTLFEIYDTDKQFGDKREALKYLETVATARVELCTKLANRYIDGEGCTVGDENYRKAIEVLKRASETGDTSAMNNLGWLYMHGLGCEPQYELAFKLFEIASKNASAAATFHLGEMYEAGMGVARDLEKAKEFYSVAVELGSKKAAERLSQMCT